MWASTVVYIYNLFVCFIITNSYSQLDRELPYPPHSVWQMQMASDFFNEIFFFFFTFMLSGSKEAASQRESVILEERLLR